MRWIGRRREQRIAGVRGEVWCYLDGRLACHRRNLYVNVGYARTASWLASNVQNGGSAVLGPGYIAVGTDATVAAPGDTALRAEVLRLPVTSASVQSVYTARLVAVFNGQQANYNLREIGLLDAAGDSGTSSGGNTSTTLNDTTKSWTANQWVGATVWIVAGTGAGQSRTVSANTATQLTVGTASTTPDATSVYAVGGGNLFARTTIAVNKAPGVILNVIWQLTLPSS